MHYLWYSCFFCKLYNRTRNKSNLIICTEADYVYYYFVEEKELHVLPMPATREWFKQKLHGFKEKKTSTPIRGGGFYVTVGRLVPRSLLLEEVAGVKVLKL